MAKLSFAERYCIKSSMSADMAKAKQKVPANIVTASATISICVLAIVLLTIVLIYFITYSATCLAKFANVLLIALFGIVGEIFKNI